LISRSSWRHDRHEAREEVREMADEKNLAYSIGLQSVGDDVTIWSKANIIGAEFISIGDSVIIDDFVMIVATQPLFIGSFVHIAAGASVMGGGRFVMEDFTGLSGGVRIYTGNEDYSGATLTNPAVPAPYRKPERSFVDIRKHAIVGANAVVLPGVIIGEGAVVGSLSLVRKDCEPWSVNFGSPARVIGSRPSETILELESQLRSDLYDGSGNYIPASER
jgi:acetyltransferase-like isoleucine patch superfamily enzyme